VEKATHGAQLPWVSSSPIAGKFYFAGKPAPTEVNLPASDAPGAPIVPRDDPTLRRDLITDCDRLAAAPYDSGHSAGLPGVNLNKIDVKSASAACDDAMRLYPDVMRFVYQAGRVASAKRNYAEAMKLFLKADEGGYRVAGNSIGLLYSEGQGVRKDTAEAFRWFKKSVDNGEPLAMTNLGVMYERGEGVAKDCPEALRLYEAAGKAGVASAIYEIGLMYHTGECVQRDYAEAFRRYTQAAALGDGLAMNNLGNLYFNGLGIPRDRKLAKQWYEKSAALGVVEAKQNLKGM
jgi:TPR repeat protein